MLCLWSKLSTTLSSSATPTSPYDTRTRSPCLAPAPGEGAYEPSRSMRQRAATMLTVILEFRLFACSRQLFSSQLAPTSAASTSTSAASDSNIYQQFRIVDERLTAGVKEMMGDMPEEPDGGTLLRSHRSACADFALRRRLKPSRRFVDGALSCVKSSQPLT